MSDSRPGPFARSWPLLVAAGWAGVVAGGVLWGHLAAWAGWAVLGLSLLAFALHGWDKWRAGRGGRRVPEAVLHLVELLGGWPGALVGRHLFRHKTVKASYRLVFWLCALTNAVLLGGIAWFGADFGEQVGDAAAALRE